MLTIVRDHGYGEDTLRLCQNYHISRKHSWIQHKVKYWRLEAYRATPVGWKVVHDVELSVVQRTRVLR
jgi:hypothetical protein